MTEIFRTIEDYPNYQVSNLGRVKSISHTIINKNGVKQYFNGRIRKINYDTGYGIVQLSKEGILYPEYVHKLVAKTFIPIPQELEYLSHECWKNGRTKLEVNHIDENPHNNSVENLEWCDRTYNNNYGTKKKRLYFMGRIFYGSCKNGKLSFQRP